MSWSLRTIIYYATIYHDVNHRVEDGVEKLTIHQVLSGGAGSSDDERILDWEERAKDDSLYGPILTRSKRAQPQDVENDYLKNGWIDDGNGVVLTFGLSDTEKSGRQWSAETVRVSAAYLRSVLNSWQAYGLEEVEVNGNKERRYTRHVHFVGPKAEEIDARLVFDYRECSGRRYPMSCKLIVLQRDHWTEREHITCPACCSGLQLFIPLDVYQQLFTEITYHYPCAFVHCPVREAKTARVPDV